MKKVRCHAACMTHYHLCKGEGRIYTYIYAYVFLCSYMNRILLKPHKYVYTYVYTYLGVGYGNPLQYFCLENSMDRGAWWAAVYGVAQSRTRLKWLSSSSRGNGGRCGGPVGGSLRSRGHRPGHSVPPVLQVVPLFTQLFSPFSNLLLTRGFCCWSSADKPLPNQPGNDENMS